MTVRIVHVCLLALFLTLVNCLHLHAGGPDLDLRISMDKDRFDSDSPIVVKVELTNNGSESVKVYNNLIRRTTF